MAGHKVLDVVQFIILVSLLCLVGSNHILPSGRKSHGPIISNGPKSLPELVQTLHRTQVQLMQMTMRLSQLESRQNFILKGRDGRDGKDGKEGTPGRDGRDGKDGKQGPPGVNGASGQPGRDGRDGKDGKPGQKGERGDKGPRGAQGPKGDLSGGLIYVRWGKSKCGANSTLVYSGRMGGELYASRGGGTSYLCLPDLMIPATNECPAGWTRDYHGYLMAASRNHHPSEFVCVDENAEAIPGSTRNKNGALLYPVEGRCGSLPCNKYINGRELTCAVCSK